jgi:hypothetical protein
MIIVVAAPKIVRIVRSRIFLARATKVKPIADVGIVAAT